MIPSEEKSEENLPLLLLFLDDSNNNGSNKSQQHKNRNFLFDRNRYSRISEGASNVLTQWPGHVSSFWLSAFIFVLMFFVLFIMLIGVTVSSRHHLRPRCLNYDYNVTLTKIYLVHRGKWHKHQLEAVEEIAKNYPSMNIDLIVLKNISEVVIVRKKRAVITGAEMNINVGRKDKLRRLHLDPVNAVNLTQKKVARVESLHALLNRYPVISLRKESMQEFFTFSPLFSYWKRLNGELVEFAARALMLWEYGGVSFKLPAGDAIKNARSNSTGGIKVHNLMPALWGPDIFVESNVRAFQELPTGVVNIDEDGLHMETKTPCHAYFGDVLANLRRAGPNDTARSIVRQTLNSFCLNGAVSDEYCDTLLKQ